MMSRNNNTYQIKINVNLRRLGKKLKFQIDYTSKLLVQLCGRRIAA